MENLIYQDWKKLFGYHMGEMELLSPISSKPLKLYVECPMEIWTQKI